MFIAAFVIGYWILVGTSVPSTKSRSPCAEEMATTFFADPLRRRGRKALVELITPTTLVLNCAVHISVLEYPGKSGVGG